jgi:hypothetical protein
MLVACGSIVLASSNKNEEKERFVHEGFFLNPAAFWSVLHVY